jgi:hypothetical protein
MSGLISHAKTTVAVVAIAAFPTLALAQTPSATKAQPNPAAEHLAAARSSLNKVLNAPAPTGGARKKLTDIKTHFIALEKAASVASPEWATHYAAIAGFAGSLIGPATSAAEPGAVATSGQTGAAPELDPAIAANLAEFRTHLTAFSKAMEAVAPSSSATAAAPSAAASAAAAPTAPPAPAPAAAPTTPAAAAASTTVSPSGAADVDLTAQIDQIATLVNASLAAASADASNVSVDRVTLEQIKMTLEQMKSRVKKP